MPEDFTNQGIEMNYEITDHITAQEYMELRELVGWSLFPLEEAEDGLKHTTKLFCFRKGGKPAALLRVLWDHGYIFYIADVIVRPEYQGQGLGRALMEHAMEYIKSKLKPNWRVKVNLMSAQGKEEFYKKFGFVTRPNESEGYGMNQWIEG